MRRTEHSPSWGSIRLTALIATVTALLLVPATQAFAAGHMTVTIAGTGTGKVVHQEGFEGNPPINCSYESPGPATGTCEAELSVFEEGEEAYEGLFVKAVSTAGSEFAGWELEGEAGFGGCSGLQCNILGEEGTISSVHITAYFNSTGPPKFPLTVNKTGAGTVTSTPAGIDCGEDLCSAEFEEGEEVELSQSAEAGSEFTGWGGACSGTGTCKVTMTEAKEVTATFKPIPRTLTVNEAGSGEGEVKCKFNGGSAGACTSPQPNGTLVEIIATAEAGSEFVGFSTGTGSATACSTSPCSFTIGANSAVTATFDLEPAPEFELEINIAGTGEGEVSCEVESGPAEPCEAQYEEGTEVALVPEAETGSEFVKWSEDCTGPGACELTMDEDKSVTATFDEEEEPTPEFNLTIVKAGTGSGSVTCNAGACAPSYEEGTEVTLAASAASGSTFSGWSGGGCSGTGNCKVTITADTTVTATFTANAKPEETCATNASLCPPPPPPAETKCIVPKLAKKTLGQAKSVLKAAHCALGKVTKSKKKGALVVKSSKPRAGTTLADGAKVNLKLGPKPKKKK